MLLDWPVRKGNKPVTTALNQAIWRAAVLPAQLELPDQVQAFCKALEACNSGNGSSRWRHEYKTILELFVHIQAVASHETVVNMCRAGLDCAYSSFVIRKPLTTDDEPDGPSSATMTMTIAEVLAKKPDQVESLKTLLYTGNTDVNNASPTFQLASPHGTDADPIWVMGTDAVAQLRAWHEYGCMEESAMRHASNLCLSENLPSYVSDKIFCLLGVTSEMGPATHLLQIPGARVMGVARSGSKLEALTSWFQLRGAASAELSIAAANLLEQIPEIAQWIVETATATANQHKRNGASDRRPTLVIMPLAYMDGEANVRVTVAMDAIVQFVTREFTAGAVALAYLTSPTTIYTIPDEAAMDAKRRYEQGQTQWTSWTSLVNAVSFGNWLQPSNTWKQFEDRNESGTKKPVVFNGVYTLQGPNYCLAKMMQQWRCIVARYGGEPGEKTIQVCAPHAPGTRTWSVLHNSSAATAVEGLQFIPPLVTFDVLPCSSLLTAILLNQLGPSCDRNESHDRSNNKNNNDDWQTQQHPLSLFWDGAVHGGGWRCPYNSDSIVALTFILGKTVAKPGWCPPLARAPKPLSSSSVDEDLPQE